MLRKNNQINDLLIEMENLTNELKNLEDYEKNQNIDVKHKLNEYNDKIDLLNNDMVFLKENFIIKNNIISKLIKENERNDELLYEKDNIINTLQEKELNYKNEIYLLNEKINNISSDTEDKIKRITEEKNIEIDKILNEKNSQIKILNDRINELESKIKIELYIHEQQEQLQLMIKTQNDLKKDLNKLSSVFMENYNENRKYFFNNQENILKKYFNTNELFKLCYFNNFKFISFSPEENRILIKTDEGIIIGSNNRFYTIKEVIGYNGYSIPQLYDFDEFIVFDVGMNRSYTSLWFANFKNCKHVYGFEIDLDTYNKALSNINLNPHLSNKISPYNIGLSNENEEVDLYYVDGCDGVNTMLKEVVELQPELQDEKKLNKKMVRVKKASEILSKIIEDNNITSKIVLKIDTEGAEYNIISDLIKTNVISKIDVLLGEGHLFKRKHFCDELKEIGFKQIDLQINSVTYNFAFVKEEYYNKWPLKK